MAEKSTKLVPGEKEIFEVRPTFVVLLAYLSPIILGIAGVMYLFSYVGANSFWIYVAVIAAGLVAALGIFLNWYFTLYRLTDRRVENRFGIIGTREEEISLDDIQAVDVETNFWGAIFNFGTVIIKAAGEKREVDFTNVANARKIASKIEDMAMLATSGDNNLQQ